MEHGRPGTSKLESTDSALCVDGIPKKESREPVLGSPADSGRYGVLVNGSDVF